MTDETKDTPRFVIAGSLIIEAVSGRTMAHVYGGHKEHTVTFKNNATLMVCAMNSHDALLKVVKQAVEYKLVQSSCAWEEDAKAAIELAEKV